MPSSLVVALFWVYLRASRLAVLTFGSSRQDSFLRFQAQVTHGPEWLFQSLELALESVFQRGVASLEPPLVKNPLLLKFGGGGGGGGGGGLPLGRPPSPKGGSTRPPAHSCTAVQAACRKKTTRRTEKVVA